MSAFCAVCTSDRGPFVTRPLGRNDALVSICVRCDSDTPRARRARPIERGYESSGGLPTNKEIRAGAAKVVDPARWAADSEAILQQQRAPTKGMTDGEQAYVAFKLETTTRIRTTANEIRTRKSRRERHTLK